MNDVRSALYEALSGSEDLTDLLATPTSVYHRVAPRTAKPPYVIFQKQAGTPNRTFENAEVVENELWVIKGVDSSGSASVTEAIAEEIDIALDGGFTVTGRATLYVQRVSDLDFGEPADDGELWQHVGGIYRIITQR